MKKRGAIDLFGHEITETETPKPKRGERQQRKYDMGYRRAVGRVISCRTCGNMISRPCHGVAYYECKRLEENNSAAIVVTDIRLRDVCDFWEKRSTGKV